ncbi:AlpA family phage regulatory protein [Escherichia albertii]|uniref:helix-turn-helix transcriptional regulator n=1 Tax=Escherichia albertii TaxID=208962 RepID=UPI0023604553|nr:AlpA family phage regulatory protein [Escherichia albertii]WDC29437.1 AlpA family phage regulatory protein [Escherichia albertii]
MNNQPNTYTDLMNDKLVTMAFITTFTGLTDKWFYKLISEGKFPNPIKLGRSSRWRESEVKRWLTERIAESRY